MAVPTQLSDLSVTISSNPPAGTDSTGSPGTIDDYFRAAYGLLAQVNAAKAPLASPTFTGTVSGITATMVGLGNVTNESKATMFTSPTFTGTVTMAAATISGTVEHNNNLVTEVKTLSFNGVVDDSTGGSSKTIDFGAGQYHKLTMTTSTACALTFTAPAGPCVVQLEMTQDGGNGTYSTTPTLKWPAAVTAAEKLLSTAAGKRDLLILRYNGTDYVASLLKDIA